MDFVKVGSEVVKLPRIMAYMWGLMAEKSFEALKDGAAGSEEFYKNKLATGKYFMERVMPECAAHLARLQTGADTMMSFDEAAF